MQTVDPTHIKLLRRAKQLVENDRAIFEQQMRPSCPEEAAHLQLLVDSFIDGLEETAVMAETHEAEFVSVRDGEAYLRICRVDIERPSDV